MKKFKIKSTTEEGGAGEEGTDKLVKKYKKDTPYSECVDEAKSLAALARRDAMKHMGGKKSGVDPADVDNDSESADDEKNPHITMQMRKVVTLRGQRPVKFNDGKSHSVNVRHAQKFLQLHSSMKGIGKEALQNKAAKSHAHFLKAIGEEVEQVDEKINMKNEGSNSFASAIKRDQKKREQLHNKVRQHKKKGFDQESAKKNFDLSHKDIEKIYNEEQDFLDEMKWGKEYPMSHILNRIKSGDYEAMQDVKPGKHVELRHHSGKRVTVKVKEEVEQVDEVKKGDWVVHPKTGHVGQVTNVSGDKEIADVKWNKTGRQTSHPKGSLQKMKEEVEQVDEARKTDTWKTITKILPHVQAASDKQKQAKERLEKNTSEYKKVTKEEVEQVDEGSWEDAMARIKVTKTHILQQAHAQAIKAGKNKSANAIKAELKKRGVIDEEGEWKKDSGWHKKPEQYKDKQGNVIKGPKHFARHLAKMAIQKDIQNKKVTKEEVEQVDELSKKTLTNYAHKVSKELPALERKHKKLYNADHPDQDKVFDKVMRRARGRELARDKFTGKARVAPTGSDRVGDYVSSQLKKNEAERDSKIRARHEEYIDELQRTADVKRTKVKLPDGRVVWRNIKTITDVQQEQKKNEKQKKKYFYGSQDVEQADEAYFKVDVADLPTMYVDASSESQVKQKLRMLLKKPTDEIKSIERIQPAEVKKAYRNLATGKKKEEENDED